MPLFCYEQRDIWIMEHNDQGWNHQAIVIVWKDCPLAITFYLASHHHRIVFFLLACRCYGLACLVLSLSSQILYKFVSEILSNQYKNGKNVYIILLPYFTLGFLAYLHQCFANIALKPLLIPICKSTDKVINICNMPFY